MKALPAGTLNKPPRASFFDWFCSDLVKLHAFFVIPAKIACGRLYFRFGVVILVQVLSVKKAFHSSSVLGEVETSWPNRPKRFESACGPYGEMDYARRANGASLPAWGNAPGTVPLKRPRAESPNHRMPQSLSLLIAHIIFSTKEREPLIDIEVRPKLHAYLATVARSAGCEAYRVGGVADHVHLAVRISRTLTFANLIEELKTSSSKWMKTQSSKLAGFSWQRGYGAFSVGPSDLEALCAYIGAQEEHHRKRTFQEEYRAFLIKYGIEFDERYVWD